MEMVGSYEIAAPRDAVWQALNDPSVLQQCIPGCQSLEKTSETEMTATATVKIGPVKASFSGKVSLLDIDAPNGYRISGEGSGGIAGFAKGGAIVRLEEIEAGTRLHYEAKAEVGGKLAQLGARLIDGVAKKMADEFFQKFSEQFPAAPEAEKGAAVATPTADGSADEVPTPEKKGFLRGLFGR